MSDWFDNLPNHPKYHDEVEIENPCLICGKESIEEYDNYYCSDNCLDDAEQELENTPEPFQEGQVAWNGYYISSWTLKPEKPYKKDSETWKLWNRGWNTNFKGIK